MTQTIQRSFTAGELSPSLHSRTDLAKYLSGLALCDNFIIRPQGGAYSRPGLRFIGDVDQPDKVHRLIPFSFNTEQTYILVFGNQKLYVVKDGAYILDPVLQIINGITQAATPVVTSFGHPYSTDETVYISGVAGMTEVNDRYFKVTYINANSFSLQDVDTTSYGAYTSGGNAQGRFVLVTPYDESTLPDLAFAQSADVMTLVHRSFAPRNLSRLADDNWTLAAINYAPTVPPPVPQPAGASRTASNITNANPGVVTTSTPHSFANGSTIQLTALTSMPTLNNRFFTVANATASTFELQGEDTTSAGTFTTAATVRQDGAIAPVGSGAGTYAKRYTYVVTAVDEDGIESLPSTEMIGTVGSLTQTYGMRLTWQAVAGADYYRVYKDPSEDSQVYGFIGESSTLSFVDYNIAPLTSDAPPQDRQPFSGAGNYPAAVTYYQQRQVFANTTNEPQTMFATQIANYRSFRTSRPTRDDDAVTRTIAAQQVNEIRHLLSLNSLLLLTSGAEWKTTEGQEQVFTPATVGVRTQSFNGCSKVPPVIINNTALYVQEKGSRIRDLGYEFSADSYTGSDISLLAEHLFASRAVKEMAYSEEPYGILWCVMDDGKLLGLTYQREQQVVAWHQHTTDGEVESVATVSENGRDAVYFMVKRVVNGSEYRYLERMEPRDTSAPDEAFCVDSGLTYRGSPATLITGLRHLEGREVTVLADGNEVKNLIVTDGAITLPRAASVVHVGIGYLPVLETLDIDNGSGSLKGRKESVSEVILEVEKSRGGWIGPKASDGFEGELIEIKPRFDADGYGPIALKTFKARVTIEPHWSRGGGLRIEQRAPLPLAILSVIPDVDVGR